MHKPALLRSRFRPNRTPLKQNRDRKGAGHSNATSGISQCATPYNRWMGTPNSAAKPVTNPVEAISPSQARAQLQKILTDSLFARTQRMSRFLRFGVEHALAGTAHQVKEYLVGVDVFDRPKDYDPRVDPIVRVEARRLRAKLRSYYASSGKKDDLLIDFPKGAYAAEFRLRSAKSVAHTSEPGTKPAAAGETSIAVLPFSNLSPGAADDYFSDGLTEELILHLTRMKGLRVVAWYSASKFRGREEDLSLIRQQLKVGVVLRGSVRRTGPRARVTVQLIDAASGAFLWADAFERGMHDIVAIQQEIAHAIVATLRPALSIAEPPAPSPRLDPACYNLCLEGRFHANRRNAEGLERSVICYQRAIEKDPECASAYAGLADAYSLLADYGIVHPHQVMPKAEAAALRALELDQNSAEVFTSLAIIRSRFEWKWSQGEDLYRRAIALNPSYAKAHHWYGSDLLGMLGRPDEAEEEIKIAVRLDPLALIVHECIGYIQMLRRNYETAIESHRRLIDMDPLFYKAHASIGRCLTLMGRYEEAIQAFESALSLGGGVPSTIAAMGQTLARAGREEEARKRLQELETLAQTRYVASSCFAVLHLGLGETSKSLDWLEKSCQQHEFATASIIVHPLWDPLRAEPRFQRILRQVASLP
jgi:TolB-like protein/Tfp pilus assembly protein PilF